MKPLSSTVMVAVMAAIVLPMLASCKSVRKETWTRKPTDWDRIERKYAGNFKIEKDDDGNPRPVKVDTEGNPIDPDEAESVFGRKTFDGRRSAYDDREVEKKRFMTEIFRKKEYKRDSYQFLKDRNMAVEEAADAGKLFSERDTEPSDGRKKLVDRNKRAERKGFFSKRKKETVDTPEYYKARKAQERNRVTEKPIINNPAQTNKPITFKDIKEMLR